MKLNKAYKLKTTSMEESLNEKLPQWKTTSIKDDLNQRKTHWSDLNGR